MTEVAAETLAAQPQHICLLNASRMNMPPTIALRTMR